MSTLPDDNLILPRQLRKRKRSDADLFNEKKADLPPPKDESTKDVFKEKSEKDSDHEGSTEHSNIQSNTKILSRLHYCKATIDLAKYLLGKYLVRIHNDIPLIGRIVETEAYIGVTDQASHTYGEKRTERNKAMYMVAGTSYVYSIYGMYFCVNISSRDVGGAVLLRALEPIAGSELMLSHRSEKRKSAVKKLKTHDLCNGPSKLCQALKIDKTLNAVDMVASNVLYVQENEGEKIPSIVACKRIGIQGYGEPAASQPYRFYIKGNKNVSVRDKIAENSVT